MDEQILINGLLAKRAELVNINSDLHVRMAVRGGRFHKRLLALTEGELVVLIGDAIAARVFSTGFLAELRAVLAAREEAR